MKTYTFTLIEEAHASCVIVTAETEEDCKEKYFMKYPKRKDDSRLVILEGDNMVGFQLREKNNG